MSLFFCGIGKFLSKLLSSSTAEQQRILEHFCTLKASRLARGTLEDTVTVTEDPTLFHI